MAHFDITSWVDFTRGLAAKAEREAMNKHLSECRQCGKIVALLHQVQTVATADSAHEVPQYAVHQAKALFALQQPEKVHILPRIVARLVFDSFREPLPAGVRSQHRISRQALYEAGDYSVDVRLEHERGSARVTLVGQVVNRTQPGAELDKIPVLLMSGKDVIAHAVSNRFGEFQMDYQPRKHLQLHVPVRQKDGRIEVRLNDLLGEKDSQ